MIFQNKKRFLKRIAFFTHAQILLKISSAKRFVLKRVAYSARRFAKLVKANLTKLEQQNLRSLASLRMTFRVIFRQSHLVYVKMKRMEKNGIFVIALGGSVIMPGKVNVRFLRNFRNLMLKQLKKNRRFIIVAGGGKIARFYQQAAAKITRLSYDDMDWLGIHSTRLNAHLLRTIFREQADPVVVDSEEKPIKLNDKIIVASGWQPGWSTDYIAVRIAKKLGQKRVIIAGRPAYVYTRDHQKYEDAKPIKKISWPAYRKLIG
jgi:uridylate kinase